METPSASRPGDSATLGRGVLLAAGAILVVATVLRVRGGWNDLWLDEIWSIEVAREVHSPRDVFTKLHHEINHYGNTLWLWVAGSRGNWFGYRVPSLLAGAGTVVIAGAIARRRGGAAVVFTMAVVACSYPLVLYASEVRGYSTLVFFSLLSYLLLDAYLRRDDWRIGAAFSLCALLGLSSHLLYLGVLSSALVTATFAFAMNRLSVGGAARRLALCFTVPLLFLAGLYWFDLRGIVQGGGGAPTGSLIADYGVALAWALGSPIHPAAQFLGCVLAVWILDTGLRRIAREDRATAVFFAGAILVFPVALAVWRDSPVLYTRHFLVSIGFLSLLLGFDLAALWERGHGHRRLAVALLAGFVIANAVHLRELFANGRGENASALRFILERSAPGPVSIGADDDYRIQRVVAFHRTRQEGGERIEYQPRGTWQGAGPAWLIVNRDSYELPRPRGDQIRDEVGRRFDYVQSFPSAPLGGLHWFLYRNADR